MRWSNCDGGGAPDDTNGDVVGVGVGVVGIVLLLVVIVVVAVVVIVIVGVVVVFLGGGFFDNRGEHVRSNGGAACSQNPRHMSSICSRFCTSKVYGARK